MSHIKYQRMPGRLRRCRTVACAPDISNSCKVVYDELLAPIATQFCSAHEAAGIAEGAVGRTRRNAKEQLAGFDSRYRMARSIVLAFEPHIKLPDTLKALDMDTDKLEAISSLLSIVQSHAGKVWADALLADSFGSLAPKVMAALEESIEAKNTLWSAQRARANAYGPAYRAYMAFKRVVLDDMGRSSVHYRRLQILRTASDTEQDEPDEGAAVDEETAPDSGVVPSTAGGSAAATDAPKSVKTA